MVINHIACLRYLFLVCTLRCNVNLTVYRMRYNGEKTKDPRHTGLSKRRKLWFNKKYFAERIVITTSHACYVLVQEQELLNKAMLVLASYSSVVIIAKVILCSMYRAKQVIENCYSYLKLSF